MNKVLSAVTLSTLIVLTGCSGGSDDDSQNSANEQNGQAQQSEQSQSSAQSEQQSANSDSSNAQQDDFESDQARLAYAVGVTLARNLQTDMPDLDVNAFTGAIQDVYGDGEPRLDDQQISEVLQNYQQQMMAEQQQQQDQAAEENATAGQNFLEENAARDGVQTTDSGLQYRVVEEGDQSVASPSANDRVRVNYEGRTIDGEVFDSSYERGEPVTFRVSQVIPGWQEALEMMHPGAEWELFIPADLAYGEAGTGPIGPNQTLLFTVELLEVLGDDSGQASGSGQAGGSSQSSTGGSQGGSGS